MLPRTPPPPTIPSIVYVRTLIWMNVPDPDGADAGAGVDEGRLKMRRKPTMKIMTPAIALTP